MNDQTHSGDQSPPTPPAIVWRLQEVMARRGLRRITDLKEALDAVGVEISYTQLTRVAKGGSGLLNLNILAGLMSALRCSASDLLTLEGHETPWAMDVSPAAKASPAPFGPPVLVHTNPAPEPATLAPPAPISHEEARRKTSAARPKTKKDSATPMPFGASIGPKVGSLRVPDKDKNGKKK